MTEARSDLITFLADEAADLVRRARQCRGAAAEALLDEAEELMVLRARLLAKAEGAERAQLELSLDPIAKAA